MAINPINVTRITQNLRADSVIQSMMRNQTDLFTEQSRISAGRTFLTPSDDPVSATRALDLRQALGRQEQFAHNIRQGSNVLSAADDAISEVNSLLIEAQTIASQNVSNLTSAAEREAEAELIANIRQQLMVVGNRLFDGRYLFAGRDTTQTPFIDALGGVAYRGDTGDLVTRIEDGFTETFNVPGNLLFGALSSRIANDVDLTPALTAESRLEDVRGTSGDVLPGGTLVFNEIGGAGVVRVNITEADTIGDVVSAINEAATEAGASFTASLSPTGLDIEPGAGELTINDNSAGVLASEFGILTVNPTNTTINGAALRPGVTRLTAVADLALGDGIDLAGGLVITNGAEQATIDLSNAETVQDIINAINNAGVFVRAQVNEAGTGIDVFNQVSGTSLNIGENGGTTAGDLGIRTFNEATPLSGINFGRGFGSVEGEDDLRITARDGSTVDVNLDGANNIGDVITLINEAATDAGVSIEAGLAQTGNGIAISDSTGGTDELSVTGLNTSFAAEDLGLMGSAGDEDVLVGDDVNPTRTEGILGALVDLETALRKDDTQGISLAAARLDEFVPEVTRVHGIVGARSQAMQSKLTQMQDASQTTEIFLSEVQDLDYAEAITRLQSTTTQLQASFQTSSILLNLSLLDFLG